MRTVVLALVLAACGGSSSKEAARGQVVWLKNIQGSNADGLRTVVDARDQLTVAAFNTGVVDMGGGALGEADVRQLVLARYGSGGNHLWSKSFAGGFGSGIGLAVTGSGDVVLSLESLTSTVDLGAGSLEPLVTGTSVSVGVTATFEGDDGTLLWARQVLAGTNGVLPSALVLDGSDDLVIAGTARAVYDAEGAVLATPGDERAFVGKLASTDGSVVWQTDAGQTEVVGHARSVAATDDGSVYATVALDPPADPEIELEDQPLDPHLVVRLDADDGSAVWTQTFDLVFSGALTVAVGAAGNPVIAGDFLRADPQDEADTTRRPLATVMQLASADGGAVWWTPAIGTGTEGDRVEVSGLTYDGSGKVVLAGRFAGTVDFNGRTLSSDSYALFVYKLDSEGSSEWVRHSGGTGDVTATSVVTDRGDNVIASGMFKEQAAEGEAETAAKPNEVFLLKLSP